MNIKLKTRQGFIQEINVEKIIEIDGRSFEGVRSVDVSNLEDRIQILERLVKNLCDFCDSLMSKVCPKCKSEDIRQTTSDGFFLCNNCKLEWNYADPSIQPLSSESNEGEDSEIADALKPVPSPCEAFN